MIPEEAEIGELQGVPVQMPREASVIQVTRVNNNNSFAGLDDIEYRFCQQGYISNCGGR